MDYLEIESLAQEANKLIKEIALLKDIDSIECIKFTSTIGYFICDSYQKEVIKNAANKLIEFNKQKLEEINKKLSENIKNK